MNLVISKDKKDIEKVMKIVSTFGGSEEELLNIEKYVSFELNELGGNRVLLIAEKSEVVGCLQILLKEADGDKRLAQKDVVAHIHALQIAKPFQRQGFARAMMVYAEQWLKNNGYKSVTLGVDSDNIAALSLYDKLEYMNLFEAEGREEGLKVIYKVKEL